MGGPNCLFPSRLHCPLFHIAIRPLTCFFENVRSLIFVFIDFLVFVFTSILFPPIS